jgi:hypothetical protein
MLPGIIRCDDNENRNHNNLDYWVVGSRVACWVHPVWGLGFTVLVYEKGGRRDRMREPKVHIHTHTDTLV